MLNPEIPPLPRGHVAATIAAIFIHPIAWPAWGIQRIIGQRIPDWEFNHFTATPYFLGVGIAATLLAATGDTLPIIVALYLTIAMELVGLWASLDVSFGRSGLALRLLEALGKRKRTTQRERFLSVRVGFTSGRHPTL